MVSVKQRLVAVLVAVGAAGLFACSDPAAAPSEVWLIRGRVVEEQGRALERCRVVVAEDEGAGEAVMTGPDGRFCIAVDAARDVIRLEIEPQGLSGERGRTSMSVVRDGQQELDIGDIRVAIGR